MFLRKPSLRSHGNTADRGTLTIVRLIQDQDEYIVTAELDILPYLDSQVQPVTVSVQSLGGKLITDSCVDLGSRIYHSDDYGCNHLTCTFSFRIPKHERGFALAASAGDVEATLQVSRGEFEELDEQWLLDSLSADRDLARYTKWFKQNRANEEACTIQRLSSERLAIRPTFSFIVPLYKTPLPFLKEMVESVLAQTYPYFELLLVNASPEDKPLCAAAEAYAAQDRRIRHLVLDGNRGITENTNVGILEASGDFLAFLDHDDTIEPDLLFCYAKGINDYPETDLLYCDEDHLKDGVYYTPFFKPDWDPDLLCSENYVTHLLTVRKSIVDALPELPDKRFDGSQDHNMTLLVGEQARNVYHARRVLYHWRVHENSTAGKGVEQKSYALEAERLAVQNHLDRCNINATAVMELRMPGRCEVVYHFDEHPLVSIVIPNKDAVSVLDTCITSILDKTSWPNYEIIVVENNSEQDETFAYYESLPSRSDRIRVITSDTAGVFNFSKVINDGCAAASGEYYLMLNNDTEVLEEDWIHKLMGPCMYDSIGAVGCKLLFADDTYQHVGIAISRKNGPFHVDANMPKSSIGYYETDMLTHRVTAVTGACLLTKKKPFDLVGGLDETLSVNFNDVDFCLRLQEQGYAVLAQMATSLRHYESATRPVLTAKSTIALKREYGIFLSRWPKVCAEGDRYYSPNFSPINPRHILYV